MMEKNELKRWMIIINPKAGMNQAEKEWPKIREELVRQEFCFEARQTEEPWHAIKLVSEATHRGFKHFIAIGGDGTLNEVINGIMLQEHIAPKDILLGMISVGTGNDWIKTHQISEDYKTAIEQIRKGQSILHDVGRITYKSNCNSNVLERFFVNSVGIGFDARVVSYTLKDKEKGKSNKSIYWRGLIRSLFTSKNVNSQLYFDDEKIENKLFNLTIGIGRYKGGGFKMLPNALPNDGKLDITIACQISKRKLIASLPKIFTGKVEKIKYFDFYKVENIRMDISAPIHAEADGEYLGLHPLEVSVLPSQLQLISNFQSN